MVVFMMTSTMATVVVMMAMNIIVTVAIVDMVAVVA